MGQYDLGRRTRDVPPPVPRRARAIKILRRVINRIDIWIQDHCFALFFVLLSLGLTSTGLLLLWKSVQVITLAKQLAPVLTVLSITITALLAALRWFRMRRDRR